MEHLDLVEDTVELEDTLLNLEPSLVHVPTVWNLGLIGESLELILNNSVGLGKSVDLLVGFFHLLHLVGWVDKDPVSLIVVHVDVDISARNGLHLRRRPVTKVLRQRHGQILLSHFEVLDGGEHGGVVVVQLRGLIFQPDELKALAADVAPVDWAFSEEIVHLLVRVGVILDTWAHADHNTPRGVGGEDEHWVVDSSELGVHCSLHVVPLVHLEGVVSDGG